MAYSKEEIKAFAEKDLRISKLAIVKSLIEKAEDIYEVQKITELAEEYINYVYEERRDISERKDATKRGDVSCVTDPTEPKWGELAVGLNLAIPTSQNVKILNQILDEYKQAHKASANPTDVLSHCINRFGGYPAKTESVSKVIKSLTET